MTETYSENVLKVEISSRPIPKHNMSFYIGCTKMSFCKNAFVPLADLDNWQKTNSFHY